MYILHSNSWPHNIGRIVARGTFWSGAPMNRQERIDSYSVVGVVLAMAVFILLIPVLGLFRATGAFGLLALWGLSPLLAWRKRESSEVIGDERDRAINSKSTVIGYSVFWVFFVLSSMVPCLMY